MKMIPGAPPLLTRPRVRRPSSPLLGHGARVWSFHFYGRRQIIEGQRPNAERRRGCLAVRLAVSRPRVWSVGWARWGPPVSLHRSYSFSRRRRSDHSTKSNKA